MKTGYYVERQRRRRKEKKQKKEKRKAIKDEIKIEPQSEERVKRDREKNLSSDKHNGTLENGHDELF